MASDLWPIRPDVTANLCVPHNRTLPNFERGFTVKYLFPCLLVSGPGTRQNI